MYINGVSAETVSIVDNIATFTARNFYGINTIMVSGTTTSDTFTLTGGTEPSFDYVEIAGTKWATKNIGASSVTDYGNYYQYGKGANDYSVTSGESYYNGTEKPLALSADTAVQVWGNGWHMPTTAQFTELSGATNSTWTGDYKGSGVSGLVLTDKIDNTKELFLPAAGIYQYGALFGEGYNNSYWTSIPGVTNLSNCTMAQNKANKFSITRKSRDYGLAIRAVKDYEYVDLGLPSGTLWAKYNVGATSETEYGNYYQYGKGADQYAATSGQSDYSGTENPLATSADTAVQVCGWKWHMPTSAQCQELIDNTTYSWETDFNGSGVNGGKFTAQNGNYVFFPANGQYFDGRLLDSNSICNYYTSTPYEPDAGQAHNLKCQNGNPSHVVSRASKERGFGVRPVI
jgi:uncharacterized protein (TIGR02145 family)